MTSPPTAPDVTEALVSHYGFTPASLGEGPSGTATRNYLAEEGDGRRWFVKTYAVGTDLAAEEQALALGEYARRAGVPVPAVRPSLTDGRLIAATGSVSLSVSEWVEDAETAEGGLFGDRWAAVGALLGRLHHTLAHHPVGPPHLVPARQVCDVERAERRLCRLLSRWTATATDTEFDRWARQTATVFAVVLGLGALGAAAGALTAPALARRYGPGPMVLTALAVTPLTQLPLLLASPGLT
ncbi:phosphotransferase [Streptomyces fragilis]|uniref:Phosphotransferase n=1 Tax=Streptomyces fragilis TaxID=67301 RepID=A0ABV2YC75_9ACTN|nr:phosphotransferase [Streptomyces fragilis]